MPKVIKAYKEKKSEMVAAALSLFSENGYDQSTANAIIEKLGYPIEAIDKDIIQKVVDAGLK